MSPSSDLSVTEVRNALRCPRVFALGRARGQAVVFPISASSLGALFHRVAEVFARDLDSPPVAARGLPAGAPRELVARTIAAWLLDRLIDELPRHPGAAGMPAEIDDLSDALRGLAGYLAREVERSGEPAHTALRSLVQHAELSVTAALDGGRGAPVRLKGRVDAVYCRSTGAIDVIEYKLTDEASQELDQAQVALYRRLLKHALDIDAEPVILRFNPGLIETRLSPAASDAILSRRVLPLLGQMAGWIERPETAPPTTRRDLCAACPVRAACADVYRDRLEPRDLPPAGATRPRPGPDGRLHETRPRTILSTPPHDAPGHVEAAELGKQILGELRRQGVMAQIAQTTVGPRLLRVEVVSPRQRVAILDKTAADVEHHLSDQGVRFEREGPRRLFVAPRKAPRSVALQDLLAEKASWLAERPGRFVVGEGVTGEVVTGDLSDGSTCHLLIGGQSGSGKSVLLRALVSSMCHFHPPSAIRFTLVDPKRVTFGSFAAGVAAHLSGPIYHDAEALLPELDALVAEMEARYEQFLRASVDNINDYNETCPEPVARRVVVVDEFQDLILDKDTRQAFLEGIKRLGAKARAAGIHLILATQRPDKDAVPGAIKANLGGKIALKVQAAVNSRIILDHPGAERLLGKGDMLADLGHGIVRAQAPMA